MGTGAITDLVDDFVSELGIPRINAIEGMTNYWKDFNNEMQFLQDQESHPVRIDGHWYTYKLAKNFAELQLNIEQNENEDTGKGKANPIVISLIPASEGLHILNC